MRVLNKKLTVGPEDIAYASSWDGNVKSASKNAIYDKLEDMGSETVLSAIKGSDESVTSSTTLQDDDDLTITLAANGVYKFEAMIIAYSASTTPELKAIWQEADGGFDFLVSEWNSTFAPSADSSEAEDSAATLNYDLNGTNNHLIYYRGIIQAGGSGGAFKYTWAQNVSNATATTLKAGSWMRATKVN